MIERLVIDDFFLPMLRPWHKSLLFRLGLPALLFLLWAWADSNSHGTTFLRVWGAPGLVRIQVIDHSRGALRLADQRIEIHRAVLSSRSEFGRTSLARRAREWFPAPLIKIARQAPSDIPGHLREPNTQSLLILPHWLLILLYLALWSLALSWRHRRIKRSSTFLPPAQPQTG
jgi:hypothetical protein